METILYNGLRNLLHEQDKLRRVSLVYDETLEKNVTRALESLADTKLLLIYKQESGLQEHNFSFFPEGYKNCVFLSGKFLGIDEDLSEKTIGESKEKKLSFQIGGIENAKDISKDKNRLLISLKDIIDVIPEYNIDRTPDDAKNKCFGFYSLDHTEKGHNLYNIFDKDPASAYMGAKYNHNLPLRLSSIQKITAGMQFNYGRGEGSKDLY
ncbi:MAG TPA: hypothetical protein VEC16_04225 [Alphaproteobacteria bacterium]|nr:hypothetical protein [Alphaproteobacteria bacterium]